MNTLEKNKERETKNRGARSAAEGTSCAGACCGTRERCDLFNRSFRSIEKIFSIHRSISAATTTDAPANAAGTRPLTAPQHKNTQAQLFLLCCVSGWVG